MGYCPEKKWIIMEWMERGSLFNLLHGNKPIGQLSWRRKVSMAKDVACALLYLHNSKIRHCDLNSKNLLVTKELKIKGIHPSIE
jgi:serine/threonine protein kinase